MVWTKYNNPSKKKKKIKKHYHSQSYINERKEEMYQQLANTETNAGRNAIIDAFYISINP